MRTRVVDEFCPLPAGDVTLEGCLAYDPRQPFRGLVLLCPPHPVMAGEMSHPVMEAIAKQLGQAGVASYRFNYPGIGKSPLPPGYSETAQQFWINLEESGDYSLAVEWVRAIWSYLPSLPEGGETPLFCVGYSFGAVVGLQATRHDDALRGFVGISPPPLRISHDWLLGVSAPCFFIRGSDDLTGSAHLFSSQAMLAGDHIRVASIPATNHFYIGREVEVAVLVMRFLTSLLPPVEP